MNRMVGSLSCLIFKVIDSHDCCLSMSHAPCCIFVSKQKVASLYHCWCCKMHVNVDGWYISCGTICCFPWPMSGTWKGGREKAPAAFCRKALTTSTEYFEMWGDGKQSRSFTFIDDCVEGVLRLMFSDCDVPINL